MESKELKLGMTKAQVRELIGPPDGWGGTSRKYKEPCIWKYNGSDPNTYLQLTFWTHKYRTPYPGPVLIGVREVDIQKEFGEDGGV